MIDIIKIEVRKEELHELVVVSQLIKREIKSGDYEGIMDEQTQKLYMVQVEKMLEHAQKFTKTKMENKLKYYKKHLDKYVGKCPYDIAQLARKK